MVFNHQFFPRAGLETNYPAHSLRLGTLFAADDYVEFNDGRTSRPGRAAAVGFGLTQSDSREENSGLTSSHSSCIAVRTRSCGIRPPQLSSARMPHRPISSRKFESWSAIIAGVPT